MNFHINVTNFDFVFSYLQDYLGGVIVFLAIVAALFTAKYYPSTTSSSLVALSINYTLLIPIYLNWVVKLFADMEMYIGAVERISHYIDRMEHHIHDDNDNDENATELMTMPTQPKCECTDLMSINFRSLLNDHEC